MRSVSRNIREKGIPTSLAALDPGNGLLKPYIRAVAPVLLDLVPMAVVVIEVVVPEVVGGGCDSPGRMIHGFLEAAVLWPVGVVVAQVPYASS